MINYEDKYRNVFREAKENHDILNRIHGICISAIGYSTDDVVSSTPSAILTYVNNKDGVVVFTLNIDIPVLDINKIIQISDTYQDDDITVRISHDLDPSFITDTALEAQALLKSFDIKVLNKLSILGSVSRTPKFTDGYNTHVYMMEDSIHIVGGPGLGKGRYKGSTDENTLQHYQGIKSINGLRSSRNVDIRVSNLLHEHGASVS